MQWVSSFIYSDEEHDVAVEMVCAADWSVANNTVVLNNPTAGTTGE